MIIENNAGRFYYVEDAGMDQAWRGYEVKRVKGEWVRKSKAQWSLVRKACTRVVQA